MHHLISDKPDYSEQESYSHGRRLLTALTIAVAAVLMLTLLLTF
jgi:hypothetical protein